MPSRKGKNRETQVEVEEQGAGSGSGEAQADLRLRGKPEDVRKALGPDPDNGAEEPQSREQEVALALKNPNLIAVVRRTHPKVWEGLPTRVEVCREECPVGLEDLKQGVFEEHGGWKYQLRVQDSDGTCYAAYNFENPNTRDPILPPEVEVEARTAQYTPRDVPPSNPLDRTHQVLSKEIELMQKQREIEAMEETLESMKRKRRKGIIAEDDPRIAELEDQLEEMRHVRVLEAKAQADDKILRAIEGLKVNGGGDGGMTQLMLQFMQNSQQQFQASQESIAKQFAASQAQTTQILQMMMQSNQALLTSVMRPSEKEGFDRLLDKVGQIKNLFENRQPSKSEMVEDMMHDLLMEKIRGDRGPDEDEDVMKFAIKQLTPVLKTYAEKAVNQRAAETQAAKPMTEEERKKLISEEARRVAKDFVARLQAAQAAQAAQAGQLPPAQPAPAQPPALLPPPPGAGNPSPAPAPVPPPAQMEPMPSSPDDEEEEVEDDMPPGPQSPLYNRKVTVNKILDNVLIEIEEKIPANSPEDSYIVGDCVDCLDSEVLQEILGIVNGTDLENLLLKHGGEPQKIAMIKTAGDHDPVVKRWLNRIVVTVQEEYERQSSKATAAK